MAETTPRRGGSLGFVVGFAIAIPATIFALSNLESANVEFLGWTFQLPLWAVIAVSFAAGALLGIIVLLGWQARRKRGRKKAAKREQKAPRTDDTNPALEPGGSNAGPASRPSTADTGSSASDPAAR